MNVKNLNKIVAVTSVFVLFSALVTSCSQSSSNIVEQETGNVSPLNSPKPTSVSNSSEQPSVAPDNEALPIVQEEFLAVLDEYREYLENLVGGNELKYSATRLERDKKLCAISKGGFISSWVGRIGEIREIRGKAQVIMQMSDNKLSFVNDFFGNEYDGFNDSFLIAPSSPLFKKVFELNKGDLVKFSGKLMRSQKTCISNSDDSFYEIYTTFRIKYSKFEKI